MLKNYKNSYLSYFLMYTFYFLSFALFSSLISVYLLDKGYGPSQVSLVVSVSFFTSMLAQPFMGALNDRYNVKTVTIISFALTILGAILFLLANSIWFYIISYSLVLLLINGTNPVMEQLATSSPYHYGKIRIWGTIGYALGTQIAGLIYDFISPQAIYIIFVGTMLLAIIGTMGIQVRQNTIEPQTDLLTEKNRTSFKEILKDKTFLLYMIIVMLFSGVMNTGHTYLPAMLEADGLSVGLATTVVSLSVICESPLIYFSHLFMDKFKSKQLFLVSVGFVLLQYLIYALHINITSTVAVTLLAKHAAAMLFIMLNIKIVASLVDRHVLITALALIQTARNLSSIIFQSIAGQILEVSTYTVLCWVLVAVLTVIFVMVALLNLPSGNQEKLFSR
ncbi:MAG: MFS transporter [Streptococcus parauberis]